MLPLFSNWAIIRVAREQPHDSYDHNCFAVNTKKGEKIVGHVPQELSGKV